MSHRLKVGLSAELAQQLEQAAAAAQLTQAGYVRALIVDAFGPKKGPPKPNPKHGAMLTLVEIHNLAMQIQKLGTNINQIARQANTGMVPITRPEAIHMINAYQVAISHAIAVLEKARAA